MDFDLFVIGAGSGGVRAARVAASYGARVAIAEEYRYGGTCVIRGCIAKKLFFYASQIARDLEYAKYYGWSASSGQLAWQTLIANKDREINRLSELYQNTLRTHSVQMINGRARLVDAHSVEVEGNQYTAKYILIATGATPWLPNIPGTELAISSNEAFHLESFPQHLVIVGGGYIAVEFAAIFAGLGAQICLVHRRNKVLRGFDDDIQQRTTAHLAARGVDCHMAATLTDITRERDPMLRYTLSTGHTDRANAVLFATGRLPNTSDLGLENAGVLLTKNKAIAVDTSLQTSVKNIYAVGDVTGRLALTPIAIHEGQVFADTLFGQKSCASHHHLVPTAVFTQPPVATIGLSESAARSTHSKTAVYKSEFRPLKQTMTPHTEKTFIKLVVAGDDEQVVGLHMIGEEAPEIVQTAAIAIQMGATKRDFEATMALHPTTAEELVLLR